MCQFFSAILTRTGDVRFCESDSHEDILERLGWPDDRPLETRGWVRVEVMPDGDGWSPVRVDETSVPGWYDDDRPRYEGIVMDTATRARPAWEAYEATKRQAWEAHEATKRQAWEAYEATKRPAREAYEAIERTAWEAYEAAKRTAWEAYEAAKRPAWEAYEAAKRPARDAYEAIERTARDAYEATKRTAREAYARAIRTITGYVPARA